MKKLIFIFLSFFAIFIAPTGTHAQIITTTAGCDTAGYGGDNGPATNAKLSNIRDVAIDDSGNVYITDYENDCIRKVDKYGIISTFAGTPLSPGYTGDHGMATNAQLNLPYNITIDRKNNIYFTEQGNSCVRKIDTAGIITTIAGTGVSGFGGDNGQATAAQLSSPVGVAVDKYGHIYISDDVDYRIRMVDTAGIITTIAGIGAAGFGGDNGPATAALIIPQGITVDTTGNIYFSDLTTRIRKIDTAGIITTICGTGGSGPLGDGGPATAATISAEGIEVDALGNIYIADRDNARIRKINATGIISTVAGNGVFGFNGDNGPATLANLSFPIGVTIDRTGIIYIADQMNRRVRCIKSTTGIDEISVSTQQMALYPNPAQSTFTVTFATEIQDCGVLRISDVLGREIKKIEISRGKQMQVTLDVPDGVYYVSVPGSSSAERLIVRR